MMTRGQGLLYMKKEPVKTTTKAKLILASKNALTGDILYTFKLTFPRIILAEVNTHRMASRNASSSRAVPAKTYRKRVRKNPFIPVHIGRNKRGMQAGEELTGIRRMLVVWLWLLPMYVALLANWAMEKLGVHKQIANRLLEPWVWVEQVFSATELDNFFLQRDHKDAEPHFHELARQMHEQVNHAKDVFLGMKEGRISRAFWYAPDQSYSTTCQIIQPGQWHLPFTDDQDRIEGWGEPQLIEMSVARCAHVSYYTPETGARSKYADCKRVYQKLCGSVPMHMSPLEHPAMATAGSQFHGNFKGFKQYRKMIAGEDGRQAS